MVASVKPQLPADLYYHPITHQLSAYILWKITPIYRKVSETDIIDVNFTVSFSDNTYNYIICDCRLFEITILLQCRTSYMYSQPTVAVITGKGC